MYNIVFPTNFSKQSKKVITEFINKFTPTLNVEIAYYFVHGYSLPNVGQHIMIDINESLEKNAEEDMKTFIQKIQQNISPDIPLNSYIEKGSFESVLHKFDNEYEINLMVLIETKKSPYKQILSEKSLSNLSLSLSEPILYIPSDPHYVMPQKAIFATDLKPFDNMYDFKNFLGFIKNSQATLEFVHVAKGDEKKPQEKFHQIFYDTLQQYGMENSPLTILEGTEVNKTILQYIKKYKPEMIALVEREGNLFNRLFSSQTVDVISSYDQLPVFVISEHMDDTL